MYCNQAVYVNIDGSDELDIKLTLTCQFVRMPHMQLTPVRIVTRGNY